MVHWFQCLVLFRDVTQPGLDLPVGRGCGALLSLKHPVENLDICIQHELLRIRSLRKIFWRGYIRIDFKLVRGLEDGEVRVVLLLLEIVNSWERSQVIVDADELEVGKVAISDGLEEVGDILPVDVVVFQMHLVISHSSGKHQGGVQSLNTMVLSKCPDVDPHGLIVG